jgi:hypothetical protein
MLLSSCHCPCLFIRERFLLELDSWEERLKRKAMDEADSVATNFVEAMQKITALLHLEHVQIDIKLCALSPKVPVSLLSAMSTNPFFFYSEPHRVLEHRQETELSKLSGFIASLAKIGECAVRNITSKNIFLQKSIPHYFNFMI